MRKPNGVYNITVGFPVLSLKRSAVRDKGEGYAPSRLKYELEAASATCREVAKRCNSPDIVCGSETVMDQFSQTCPGAGKKSDLPSQGHITRKIPSVPRYLIAELLDRRC